jgi:hypothetical protein
MFKLGCLFWEQGIGIPLARLTTIGVARGGVCGGSCGSWKWGLLFSKKFSPYGGYIKGVKCNFSLKKLKDGYTKLILFKVLRV